MRLEVGSTLAGYCIEGLLGQGGMGVVYEARQLALDRVVALKVLSPELSGDESFRERFRREGLIQARIDHPNIVPVIEAGEFEGALFLSMRLVRGSNLKDLITARDLEAGRTLRLLVPVAEALDLAHESGLIHRDVKPQNILVGAHDHVFLADFGLTKGPTEQRSLTRTGQFVGTLDYVSPEQIRGEEATARSDVYSIGAVLYECLTGVVPFPKQSDVAVLFAHMSDAPPLVSEQRPDLPGALDEVLVRAMAKNPAERPGTVGELMSEAERAFGRRIRAAITPPLAPEVPEEAGIRRAEEDVSTLETRVRRSGELGGTAAPDVRHRDAPPATETPAPAEAQPAASVTAQAGLPPSASAVAEIGQTVETDAQRVRSVPDREERAPSTPAGPTASAPADTRTSEAPARDADVEVTRPPSAEHEAPARDADVEVTRPPSAEHEAPTAPSAGGDARAPSDEHEAPTAPTAGGDTPARSDEHEAPNAPSAGGDTRARSDEHEAPTPPAGQDVRSRTGRRAASRSSSRPAPAALAVATAGAAGAAAPPVEAPLSRPARTWRRAGFLGPAIVLALAAIAAGLLAGRSGSEPSVAPPPPPNATTANGDLELSFTSAWRSAGEPPRIPGLAFARDLNLRLGDTGAGLSAGQVAGSGPSLLPPGFLRRLPGEPARTDRVRLGEVAAYRYRGLRPRGFDRPLTLYVMPTTAGVASVACYGASRERALPSPCEEVAGSLRLIRSRPLPLGPDPAYARRLNAALGRLNARRAAASGGLRTARTRRGQARAATRVGGVYRAARLGLARVAVGPATQPTHRKILRGLTSGKEAYTRLASAARRGQRARYRTARRAVRAADRAVQAALAELRGLGYTATR